VAGLKGNAKGTVDIKGRVSLPAKYRKLLPEELVLVKSPDREIPALLLYSESGFEEWIDAVLESKGGYKANDKSMDKVIKEYYINSEDIHVDGIGRIGIPPALREYAGINKEVMICGARDHLELVSVELWEAFTADLESAEVYDNPTL
jgi:MraZ protein